MLKRGDFRSVCHLRWIRVVSVIGGLCPVGGGWSLDEPRKRIRISDLYLYLLQTLVIRFWYGEVSQKGWTGLVIVVNCW